MRTLACASILILTGRYVTGQASPGLPMVINTWGGPFTAATDAAYAALTSNPHLTALDAVVIGCATCERQQCDGTVGYGGSPDENCETTLDAMIMDGDTFNSGAVAGLRRVRDAISVARHVMDYTAHSLLAGDLATQFAVENGFREDDLTTNGSAAVCEAWKAGGCQPNYRVNVTPEATSGCGPYAPNSQDGIGIAARHAVNHGLVSQSPIGPPHSHGSHGSRPRSHDTISMVTIHSSGSMASGTSTNGAAHKVPGRVGDGPIVGSGSYVDSSVGGCGATGDGDVMMRFLPCYQAVENLRRGMTPTQAAEDAVSRMLRKFPQIQTGVVVVDKEGNHGGAGSGWTFTYAFRGRGMNGTEVVEVPPLSV